MAAKKILVVDDDHVVRKIIVFNLDKAGYQTLQAENPEKAFEALAQHEIDLVYCDVNMQGMDGFEFCKKVRSNERFAALPFIFLTARTSDADRSRAFQLGADDFIPKPFKVDELLLKTKSLLKRIEIYQTNSIRRRFESGMNNAKHRVLLLDDEPVVLQMLSKMFNHNGMECKTADTAQEALAIARSFLPDIILSDLNMPGTDGRQFRRLLQQEHKLKNIPFVFLTASDNETTMLESFDLDIKDYILKDTRPTVLITKVVNIIKTTYKERENTLLELQHAADSMNLGTVPDRAPAFGKFAIDQWHVPFQSTPGGDFIDYIRLDEARIAIILGDIMGKKWGAWFFTFSFISYLRSAIRVVAQHSGHFTARDILRKVNESIYEDSTVSEIFSAISLAVLDKEAMTLQYCGAGDLPALFYNAAEGRAEQLESGGVLLGSMANGEYDEAVRQLLPGDTLLLYTDGLTDSRGVNEEPYGEERLLDAFTTAAQAKKVKEQLTAGFSAFTGNRFDDDVSFITVRVG